MDRLRDRVLLLSLCLVALFSGVIPPPAEPEAPARVSVVVPNGWPVSGFERLTGSARRRGIEVTVRREGEDVPAGSRVRVVRLAAPPISDGFRRRLARYPVTLEAAGFSFDRRSYRALGDAIALTDPESSGETLVLGNSPEASLRMVRWALGGDGRAPGEFRAVSGELSKEGRFRPAAGGGLEIDRARDVDRISDRESFFASLLVERRGGVQWRFRESERAAFEKWSPIAQRLFAAPGTDAGATATAVAVVVLYPDPASKGLYTGSSRPADLVWEHERVRIDLDASAPAEPDLVSPGLASAALAAREPRWRDRPQLLAAAGAREAGRWWGRDVASFAAFSERAGVHPEVREVLAGAERDDLSPIVAIGAAASWLDAGLRAEGADALAKAVASPDRELAATLERWRRLALGERASAPRPRPLRARFLRGISYAMSNSVEGSYASPRSLETLRRLSTMAVNSISVMPFGFSRDERVPEIGFVHRSPRGETDEGTVRAVADARVLGMTAMVKPHIWIGGGAFVGTIAMSSAADWSSWFRAYRRFVVHHALVAEAAGAALFCVGTELSGTESREKEWRDTVAAVRLATGAPLVYTTNWAAGAPNVRFWDALDVVGADFYDPLSADPNASDGSLVEGARRAALPLARLAAATGKPVVLAEAGYPPARGAWTAPHDENAARPFAPEDAARAVRALFAALSGQEWWRGVYWWKTFSDGRDAGPSDRSFNFLGRPAGEAIAAGFRKLAALDAGTR